MLIRDHHLLEASENMVTTGYIFHLSSSTHVYHLLTWILALPVSVQSMINRKNWTRITQELIHLFNSITIFRIIQNAI